MSSFDMREAASASAGSWMGIREMFASWDSLVTSLDSFNSLNRDGWKKRDAD